MTDTVKPAIPETSLQRSMDLLKLHQQRSRFIANAYHTPLSLVDAYVVIEIDVNPDITLLGLSDILPIHKDVIARTLVRLEKDAYLQRGWNKEDMRQRQYKITAKGKKFLALHDENSRQFLSEYLSKLTLKEIAALQRLQHVLCDSLNAPAVHLRSVEHPFEEGIRRVTRAMGFIGQSLFGSKYSSTEWQIFSMIAADSSSETVTSLSQQLSIPTSTLSQCITRYVKSGLIQKKTAKADKRIKSLELTKSGQAALASIESHGKNIIASAFTADEVEEFNSLLEKHLGLLPEQSNLVLRQQLQIKQVVTEEDRRSARGFLIFHSTRLRKYFDLPEEIIATRNHSFVLNQGDSVLAVCEIALNESAGTVLNCAWSERCDSDELLVDFLAAVLNEHLTLYPVESYVVRPGLFSDSILTRLQLISALKLR